MDHYEETVGEELRWGHDGEVLLATDDLCRDQQQRRPCGGVDIASRGGAAYELGLPPQLQVGTLYPIFVRGQAYLVAHNGSAAAVEFREILIHRGIVLNFPVGA